MSWASEPERSSDPWLRLMTAVYRSCGRRFCDVLLYPIAAYFFLVSAGARAASRDYLRRVFPGRGAASLLGLSYLHFLEFSRALLDKFSVWQGDIRPDAISFEGKDDLRRIVNGGMGAIVLGAHFGNIEILRAIARDVPGVVVNALMFTKHNPRFNALMFTKHNPRFNALIEAVDPGSRVRIVETDSVTPDLVADLQERLSRGELIAMLADRVTPGSPGKTVEVDFLGGRAELPAGPLILSSLLGRPVFLVFCARVGPGIYRVFFERFSDGISLPRRGRAEILNGHVRIFAARLEEYCRRFPLQWFNFYDYWKGSTRAVNVDDRAGRRDGDDAERDAVPAAEGIDPVE